MPTTPGPHPAFGVYVHIPFCLVRCHYCDFNAYAGMEHLAEDYVDALVAQMRHEANQREVETIFFGGGTPTRIPLSSIQRVLLALKDNFNIKPGAEITIEANPETIDGPMLDGLLACGFDRISIGVQSTDQEVLTALGRAHGPTKGLDAIKGAIRAGFKHVSGDLIYGTPGESSDSWRRSLGDVIDAGVGHLSAYALTVEQGTPLHGFVQKGTFPAPDEDVQADRYLIAHETLEDAGFVRYEVSNWAKEGAWCRHNLGYWRSDDYLGIGAGAHGHIAGRRYWSVRSLQAYISRSPETEDGFESLTPPQRIEEAAIMGLRLAAGLDRAAFASRWGSDPADLFAGELAAFIDDGTVAVTDERLYVAPGSLFVSDRVAEALIGALDKEGLSTRVG
ncbi:MAG: radical SAM family heme chaperone HemW [Actinobacteria bacterium]|nr:radical SAM family heme chaperone HemW [Actinomycetota bacterium]